MNQLKAAAITAFLLGAFQNAGAQSAVRPNMKDTQNVPRFVERMPRFEGDVQGWVAFLQKNLDSKVILDLADRDTAIAKHGIRERVLLEFIVCEDGGLCNIQVKNRDKVHPEFAAEAVRVLKMSPAWVPGTQDGKKVKVYFTQPVTFQLD